MVSSSPASGDVYVVDDQESVRRIVRKILEDAGHRVRCYDTPVSFLADDPRPLGPSCILLDQRLPGMTGLDLQRTLRELGRTFTIVLLTGYAEVQTVVKAVQQGALDVVEKPVESGRLKEVIQKALTHDACRLSREIQRDQLRRVFARLTPREGEVLTHVVAGHSIKRMAELLGLSVKTVEAHRSNIMKKLGVRSAVDVVRMAVLAGVAGKEP